MVVSKPSFSLPEYWDQCEFGKTQTSVRTYANGHLGAQLVVLVVISHGDEVVPRGVEANSLVEGALAVWRANRPHATKDFRVIGYQVVGSDADDRA